MVSVSASDFINVMHITDSATEMEYVLDLAIDSLNICGANLSNMDGDAGSKTVILTSKQRGGVFQVSRAIYYSFWKPAGTGGSASKAVVDAAGYYGPYKLILTSTFYGQLEALISNTEKWAFQAVGELIGGVENILISDNMYAADGAQDSVLLLDVQPGNFELLVGADITNFTQQLPTMNIAGKVYEAVVPVIKRPKAIVEINTLT